MGQKAIMLSVGQQVEIQQVCCPNVGLIQMSPATHIHVEFHERVIKTWEY